MLRSQPPDRDAGVVTSRTCRRRRNGGPSSTDNSKRNRPCKDSGSCARPSRCAPSARATGRRRPPRRNRQPRRKRPRKRPIGIDLAGIDKTVSAGRRLRRIRQWWLAQDRRDPRRPRQHRHLPRGVQAGREAQRANWSKAWQCQAGGGQRRARIADYYAAYMDEAGIEQRGLAPLQPELDRNRRDHRPAALARALGERPARRRRSAQRDRTTTPTACSACSSPRAWTTRAQHRLPAAGRARHAQPRLLPVAGQGDGRVARQVPGLRRRAAAAGRRRRRRRRRRKAIVALETKIAKAQRQHHRHRGRAQGQQSLADGGVRQARAGSRLGGLLRCRRTRRSQTQLIAWQPMRSASCRH